MLSGSYPHGHNTNPLDAYLPDFEMLGPAFLCVRAFIKLSEPIAHDSMAVQNAGAISSLGKCIF